MQKTDKAIEGNDYGLGDWELHEGSEFDMISKLMENMKNKNQLL